MNDQHLELCEWRTGRRNPRNLYAMVRGAEPSDEDVAIGMLDTPELALEAVEAHNARLRYDE